MNQLTAVVKMGGKPQRECALEEAMAISDNCCKKNNNNK
jgi:hypothetical protein